ncbi:hypothetical protein QJQ45_000941 [Haematococcus lacustris]|nr:hypothetical protein QJQ45_000941 [Haematococcus lacustris]
MQEDDTLGGGGSGALVGDNPRRRRRTAQRRPGREERSLACLIQALEGRRVVVELRSDIIIRGLLDEADEFLKCGVKTSHEFLYVKGRNIRFVHLPKALDPGQAIEAQRKKLVDLRVAAFKARQALARLDKGEPALQHGGEVPTSQIPSERYVGAAAVALEPPPAGSRTEGAPTLSVAPVASRPLDEVAEHPLNEPIGPQAADEGSASPARDATGPDENSDTGRFNAACTTVQGMEDDGGFDFGPRGTDQRRGRVVLVDEHRTTQVSSAVNGQQPLAPRKPPQAPGSSQEASQAAALEPGPSTPLPAKRSKRTKAEPEAAEPSQPTKGKGKGKGKAAKAKPAPQPGRWVDRDCNAALNMQRIGESKWRPLELCFWPDQGALPAKGKEYLGLGYKRLRDKPPKAQQQQPAEAQ